MGESVLTEINNSIAYIYLNEPNSLNALSKQLREQLLFSLEEIEKNDQIKFVVLSGKGKAFCAGGNVKAMNEPFDSLDIHKSMELSRKILEKIRTMPKIFACAVHGYVAGAGIGLALSTDLIFAETDTKFLLSFKNIGLIPDLGLHYYLPRKIGEWKAKEWMWTGKTLSVEEAIQYGIVMVEVEKEKVLARITEFAHELINGPIDAYIVSKLIINSTSDLNLDNVIARENAMQTILRGTEVHQVALQTFLNRKE